MVIPNRIPITFPSPPRKLHPPNTAPAIAYNSKEFPVLDGCAEACCIRYMTL
jgi:hypothetical protein